MARPLRVEFAGAVYPVMARGNQGKKICADDQAREMGSATLMQGWKRMGWCLHAWALMGNNYHLLLETPEPNRVAGMKWFQGTCEPDRQRRGTGHRFGGGGSGEQAEEVKIVDYRTDPNHDPNHEFADHSKKTSGSILRQVYI